MGLEIAFKDVLKAYRKSKGISTRKLSSMVGKGSSYVSQIENGKIKFPDYKTAYNLMKYVGYKESQVDDMLKLFNIVDPNKSKNNIDEKIKNLI